MPLAGRSEGDRRIAGWMEAHGEELRRHLAGMLGDPDEAEDVLQEVWLAAHRSTPEASEGSNPRAWLYRVATHEALDRLATRRRRARLIDGRGRDLAPEPSPAPDAVLDGEEVRERVRAGIARLPRRQREAVWLRWIEGRDYEVIARELESSPGAARANVYQGLQKLRTELGDLWREEART